MTPNRAVFFEDLFLALTDNCDPFTKRQFSILVSGSRKFQTASNAKKRFLIRTLHSKVIGNLKVNGSFHFYSASNSCEKKSQNIHSRGRALPPSKQKESGN